MRRLAIAAVARLMFARSGGMTAQGRQTTAEVCKRPTCGAADGSIGSPGMEAPGVKTKVFASHGR